MMEQSELIVGVIIGFPLLIVSTAISVILIVFFNEMSKNILKRQKFYNFMLTIISVNTVSLLVWRFLMWIALM